MRFELWNSEPRARRSSRVHSDVVVERSLREIDLFASFVWKISPAIIPKQGVVIYLSVQPSKRGHHFHLLVAKDGRDSPNLDADIFSASRFWHAEQKRNDSDNGFLWFHATC